MPAFVQPSSLFLQHILRLSGNRDIRFECLSENTRRNIRKACNDGVLVRREDNADGMKEFYRLHCMTRKRHGVPPPPFRFFQKIVEHVLERGYGRLLLASLGETVIAGAFYILYGDRAVYKYGASDPRFMGHGANHSLMWEAITLFASEGYYELHFGRTDQEDEGLRRFKKSWGASETPLAYYRYDLDRNRFISGIEPRGRSSRKLLSKMPVPFLRVTGGILYRHIG